MKNEDKSKEQLISELEEMRQRIAELQAAENNRKQAEELFRKLVDSLPIGVYIVQNRRFQFTNLQFQKYAGYTGNELIGKDPSNFIAPEDRAMVRENAVKMLKGERSSPYEYRFVNKDGEVRWVIETVASVLYQGKQVTMGNFMDITERKRAEERLRESENRYRSLLTNIPDVIWTINLQGDFVFMSPNAEAILGYTPEEMCQGGYQGIFENIHPYDVKMLTETLVPKIEKGISSLDIEYRFRRKDGEWIWLNSRTTTTYNKDGTTYTDGVSTDITTRKQAEEALRESNRRFTDIAENASEWIWEADTNGKYTYSSPGVEKVLGYKSEEMTKKYFYDLFHPDDREEMKKAAFEVFTKKQSFRQFINRNVHKSGKIIWLSTSGVPLLDKEGNLLGYRGSDIDITERKQAEEALRESEDRYRSLVTNIPDAIWTVNSQGDWVFMSPNAEAILGYTSEEICQGGYQMMWENTHPDDVKMIIEKLVPQAEKGISLDIEYRFRRRDGEWIWLNSRTTTTYNKDGTTYTDGISTNITKRKQAEEALRESEEHFRRLAENAQDMIYHYRLSPTPKYEYVSPAVTTILGYTPEEFYADPELGLKSTHPEDRPVIEAMQSSSEKWVVILRRFRKDGTMVWLEEKIVPVHDQTGNVVAVEGIIRDITEGKRSEKTLQQLYESERDQAQVLAERTQLLEDAYKELFQLDQMKDNFLSTVSHELRTPLTSIKSFAEILLSYEEGKETQREFLTIINDESDRLARLINDLLDISRIESGRMQWQSTPLAIPEVVEVAIKGVHGLFTQKNFKLDINFKPDLPSFNGDKDRLVQVMTNLLGNAIKFTPEGGKIRVAAEVLSANRAKNTPAMLKISVSDTGIGIAAENHKKIFEKFIQVGNTLTDKPKGTGLGLAICKEIIEHHGGTIWVESELDHGSTFFFTLPVVEDTERPVIAPKPEETQVNIEGSKLILVVDDEANIRKFLNHELTNRGHHVLEASRGKEAIKLAKKYHPDLITLDILMPDINGFDVTYMLKNNPDTLDIPILIISVVEEKEKGYRLGASDYVTKPFDNKALMDKIDILLKDKRKVLVVDDDESLAKAIKFELEKKGYTANVANNGEEALRAIESNCPDLVILDIFMPKMDGFEVMKTLRNKPDTANIPIIVLTGIEIDGGRVKALSLGGTEYLTKSGGLSKLFEEIENIFNKGATVQMPESPLAYK